MPEDDNYDDAQYERDRAAAYQERGVRERERVRQDLARLNVVTLFERLGYDLWNNEDVQRLNENLRYSEQERKRREKSSTNKTAWFVSFAMMVLGALSTSVIQYLESRLK